MEMSLPVRTRDHKASKQLPGSDDCERAFLHLALAMDMGN